MRLAAEAHQVLLGVQHACVPGPLGPYEVLRSGMEGHNAILLLVTRREIDSVFRAGILYKIRALEVMSYKAQRLLPFLAVSEWHAAVMGLAWLWVAMTETSFCVGGTIVFSFITTHILM